jgi:hypothetical protein
MLLPPTAGLSLAGEDKVAEKINIAYDRCVHFSMTDETQPHAAILQVHGTHRHGLPRTPFSSASSFDP